LRFYYDDSAEQGAKLSALIDDAMATNTTQGDEPDDSDSSEPSGSH